MPGAVASRERKYTDLIWQTYDKEEREKKLFFKGKLIAIETCHSSWASRDDRKGVR